MKTFRRSTSRPRSRMSGMSLVELMISLVLGLLLTGAAISVFASNKQTQLATESLGRVQESARVAFELMARDVREAGGNPCARNLPLANVINPTANNWWSTWGDGLLGVDAGAAFPGGDPANRLAGTDAVEVKGGESGGVTVTQHVATSAQFKFNTVNHNVNEGDIVLVCDYRQASLVQVTNASPGTNETVVHNAGSVVLPGNCSKGLGVPTDCSSVNGKAYTYGPNSTVVKLRAVRWYVGTNDRGGNSLYRVVLRNNAPGTPEEVTEGVEDLEISYLLPGSVSYVSAAAVGPRWGEVLAARIEVSLEGDQVIGPGGAVVSRELIHIATLRNRNA